MMTDEAMETHAVNNEMFVLAQKFCGPRMPFLLFAEFKNIKRTISLDVAKQCPLGVDGIQDINTQKEAVVAPECSVCVVHE